MTNMIRKLTLIDCRENRQKANESKIDINKLIESKDAETLYKLFDDKENDYDKKTLLDALFQIGDLEYISRVVMFKYSKCITREVFLKCAKMVVESKDKELIIEFAIGCFGNLKTFGNSFDIIDEYMEMIKDLHDKKLVKDMISLISQAQRKELIENTKSFFECACRGEFDDIVTGEYRPFDYMLYPETIKFKKRLQFAQINHQNKDITLTETV